MQDVVGTQPSKWCAGCHDHAVFFNGRFDRPIKEQIDTPEAQAGLGCTSCHSITHVQQHDGPGRLRRSNIRRCTTWRRARTRCCAAAHDRLTYLDPQPHRDDVPQAVPSRADAGVLLELPQGPSRRAGERLPLVPRLQRLRQLAGVGRLGAGRALVLLPAEAAEVRRLPHAARRLDRPGGEERQGAVAPVPGGQHRAAVREQRSRAAQGGPGLPPRRADLGRRLRHRRAAPTTPLQQARGQGGGAEPQSRARSRSARSRRNFGAARPS